MSKADTEIKCEIIFEHLLMTDKLTLSINTEIKKKLCNQYHAKDLRENTAINILLLRQ